MGVRNLLKIHKGNFPTVSLKDLTGRIAIDASVYLYRFKYADNSFLSSFLVMITNFLRHDLLPLFIFDVVPHPLKLDEIIRRNERVAKNIEKYNETKDEKLKKNIIIVTHEDRLRLKQLLNHIYIPYYDAPIETEAEAYCAYLNSSGIVDHVLSEDSDCIPYGAISWLKNYNNSGTVMQIDCQLFAQNLGFTKEDMIDYCIMLGTDYNDSIFTVSYCHRYFQDYKKKLPAVLPRYDIIKRIFTNAQEPELPLENLKIPFDVFIRKVGRFDHAALYSFCQNHGISDIKYNNLINVFQIKLNFELKDTTLGGV